MRFVFFLFCLSFSMLWHKAVHDNRNQLAYVRTKKPVGQHLKWLQEFCFKKEKKTHSEEKNAILNFAILMSTKIKQLQKLPRVQTVNCLTRDWFQTAVYLFWYANLNGHFPTCGNLINGILITYFSSFFISVVIINAIKI